MERCSLCGTPLQTDETVCSYCKHPVLTKTYLEDALPMTQAKTNRWLQSLMILFLASLGIGGAWYGLHQTKPSNLPLSPPVQALPASEWSDETSAYNQTYSTEHPPASYDILKFVRQYTQTVPETANYSKTTDTLETFSAIQFATLDVFQSEVSALRKIHASSDSPIPPRLHTVDFERFNSKGAFYEVKTVETYQLTATTGPKIVVYDVRYTVRLYTDYLQITHIARTEVKV